MEIEYLAVPYVEEHAALMNVIRGVAEGVDGLTLPYFHDARASIATDRYEIFGFVLFSSAGIIGLWVREDCRGQGVAKGLIESSRHLLSSLRQVSVSSAMAHIDALYGIHVAKPGTPREEETLEFPPESDLAGMRPAGFGVLLREVFGECYPEGLMPGRTTCINIWEALRGMHEESLQPVEMLYGLCGPKYDVSDVCAILELKERDVKCACDAAASILRTCVQQHGPAYLGVSGGAQEHGSGSPLVSEFFALIKKMEQEGVVFHDIECDMDLHLSAVTKDGSGYHINLTHYKNM